MNGKRLISLYVVVFIFVFAMFAHAEPALVLNATAVQGGSPPEMSFHIQNNGDGQLRYIITSDVSWLNAFTSVGGTTIDKEKNLVIVGFDAFELALGTHTGTITIADPLASNSPQTVEVIIAITPPPIIGITP